MLSKTIRMLIMTGLLLLLAVPLLAQDDAYEVVADGLRNPRNLAVMEDGTVYVAEAGLGGEQETASADAFGATSRISVISPDGGVDVIIDGLLSYRDRNSLGASAVNVVGDSIWVILGENSDFRIPFTSALVEFDMETARVKTYVDLLTLELEEDPDGNPNEQSNPTDFAVADDGTVYIANAGCNCLMAWSADAGLSVAVVWDFETDNPVPTSIDIGPDGAIYVGFLTGFPFPEGGSRIERWENGELTDTFGGLTAVTGIEVTNDGRIFATEYGVFNGQGWDAGRVVEIVGDEVVPVLEGLNQAYGLEEGPDGALYLSINSAAGEGSVIKFTPDM